MIGFNGFKKAREGVRPGFAGVKPRTWETRGAPPTAGPSSGWVGVGGDMWKRPRRSAEKGS